MNFVNALGPGGELVSPGRHDDDPRANPVFEVLALARRHVGLISATVVSVLCLVTVYLVFSTPSYRATVELFIDPQALQVVGRGLTRTDTAASIEFAGIDSQALILTSTSLLESVIADLDLTQDTVLSAGSTNDATKSVTVLDALRQRIVVRRVDASLVFQVTVSHPVAKQAARIANAIGAAYFKLNSRDRGSAVGKASATLADQSANLRNELAKADTAVETFKAKAGLISTGEAGLIVSQQLKDLYTQISLSEANLPRLAARRNDLRKLNASQVAAEGATPEAIVSPVIGALRAQYASIVQSEAQLARTFGDRHPELANIREQKRALLEQIQNELGRISKSSDEEYRRAQESLAALKKQAEALVGSQIASDEAKIKLRQLESEASAIRSVYDSSTARVKELQQQQQIETSNSRVISEAMVPLKPFGTPKALVLVAGALFGLVLGFALSYILELLQSRPQPAKPVVDTALAPAPALAMAPVVAELNRIAGGGTRSAEDNRALVEITKRLRAGHSSRSPAVIVVAGPYAKENAGIADEITEILARCGETVLRYRGGLGPNAIASEKVFLPTTISRILTRVADDARFIVVDAASDMVMADPAISAAASSVLLVVQHDQTRSGELNKLLAAIDRDQSKQRTGQVSLISLPADPDRTVALASAKPPGRSYARRIA